MAINPVGWENVERKEFTGKEDTRICRQRGEGSGLKVVGEEGCWLAQEKGNPKKTAPEKYATVRMQTLYKTWYTTKKQNLEEGGIPIEVAGKGST